MSGDDTHASQTGIAPKLRKKMQSLSQEQLVQDLAVLRKKFTGETAPYDRTLETLSSLNPDAVAPRDISTRLLSLAMAADRPVVEAFKASVGAVNDHDVRFDGATVGYLLNIARVLYRPTDQGVLDDHAGCM